MANESNQKDDLFDSSTEETPLEQGGAGQDNEGGGGENEAGGGENGEVRSAKDALTGLTPDQLKAIVSGAVQEVSTKKAAAQKEDDNELTPEKIATRVQMFQPDENLISLLRHEDPKEVAKALVLLTDGISRQAFSAAQLYNEMKLQELRKQMSGDLGFVRQFAKQQYEAQLRDEFFAAYPQYKGYDPLILQVKGALEAEGAQFKTKKEAFDAVHARASAVLKSLKLDPSTLQQQNDEDEAPVSNRPSRRMSTLTSGGQGGMGTAGKSGANAPKSAGQSIW